MDLYNTWTHKENFRQFKINVTGGLHHFWKSFFPCRLCLKFSLVGMYVDIPSHSRCYHLLLMTLGYMSNTSKRK